MFYSKFLIIFILIRNLLALHTYSNLDEVELKEHYVISTKVENFSYNRNACNELTFKFNIITYRACLEASNDDNFIASINLYGMRSNRTQLLTNTRKLNIQLVNGYVINHQNDSYIDGYIEDERFYGRIYIGNVVYYLEEAKNEGEVIIYKEDSNFRRNEVHSSRMGRTLSVKSHICTLVVLVDYSFFTLIGKGMRQKATARVMDAISTVNGIFRSTDFDGDGLADNIGFKVLYIIILEDNLMQSLHAIAYTKQMIDSRAYLERVSYFTNFNEACLGIVFTAQTFKEKVVGLSYTAVDPVAITTAASDGVGGICKGSVYKNLNVVVVTYMNYKGEKMKRSHSDAILAHEIGHSFGSLHDRDDNPMCKDHIMKMYTGFDKLPTKGFRFSSCSKQQIQNILLKRKNCLLVERNAFCGNGLVEEGEECDCGAKCQRDVCCTSFKDVNGCQVNRRLGYECHPSRSWCCTAKCQIRDLTRLDLNCKNHLESCDKKARDADCGVDGKCIDTKYCYNQECTRIGLKECPCIGTESSGEYCEVCCWLNGHCVSSLRATEALLLTSKATFKEFIKTHTHQNTSVKQHVSKKFCQEKQCIKLVFKRFAVDDFCTHFGAVGKCNKKQECNVTTMGNEARIPARQLPKSGVALHTAPILLLFTIVVHY